MRKPNSVIANTDSPTGYIEHFQSVQQFVLSQPGNVFIIRGWCQMEMHVNVLHDPPLGHGEQGVVLRYKLPERVRGHGGAALVPEILSHHQVHRPTGLAQPRQLRQTEVREDDLEDVPRHLQNRTR